MLSMICTIMHRPCIIQKKLEINDRCIDCGAVSVNAGERILLCALLIVVFNAYMSDRPI